MDLDHCSLCGRFPPTPPPDSSSKVCGTRGPWSLFPGQTEKEKRSIILRTQLKAFFLVNTLLQVPSDKCAGFLSSYGNPGEWMTSLCQGCLTKVEEAYELNEKIRELRKRIDSIGKDLALPLRVKREEAIDADKDVTCVDEIRDYVCHRDRGTEPGRVPSPSVTTAGGGDDGQEDSVDSLMMMNEEEDQEEEEDPLWELFPQVQDELDEVEVGSAKSVLSTPDPEEENGTNSIMTLEEVCALTGPNLLKALSNVEGKGSGWICPISGCGRLYKYLHSFRNHVKKYHPTFLPHLQKSPLPPDHECLEGHCVPSLLLDPVSFRKTRQVPMKRQRHRATGPKFLSKEQILTMSADQLTSALVATGGGKYVCPFCPRRLNYEWKRWRRHLARLHPKFLLHLKNPVPPHECEEGSCLPETSTSTTSDWVDILATREAEVEALKTVKEYINKDAVLSQGDSLLLETHHQKEAHLLFLTKKGEGGLKVLAKRHKVSTFPCQTCPQVFQSYDEWKTHQRQAHYDGFLCPVCDQKYRTPQNLENHTRTFHSLKEASVCSGCHVHHRNFEMFNAHLQKQGCDPKCLSASLPCSKCKRRYETQESLSVHMKAQHTDHGRPYACSKCPERFTRPHLLKFHTQTHLEVDGFICPQCGKVFTTSLNLYGHTKLTHDSEPRKHVCSVCGSRFQAKSGLRRHFRLHGGDKPFVCPICGKGFKLKNYLTTHSWSHDPEKRGKYAEYSQRLKNNEKRVRRGRRERVEEVQVPMDVESSNL